jgi:hypothetical protein
MNIESFFPGRIRVRSNAFSCQENLNRLGEHVRGIDGVREFSGNPRTGSVTILYDPAVITMAMLMDAKDELERLERELSDI